VIYSIHRLKKREKKKLQKNNRIHKPLDNCRKS